MERNPERCAVGLNQKRTSGVGYREFDQDTRRIGGNNNDVDCRQDGIFEMMQAVQPVQNMTEVNRDPRRQRGTLQRPDNIIARTK